MKVHELTPMVSFHFQRVSGVNPSLQIEDTLVNYAQLHRHRRSDDGGAYILFPPGNLRNDGDNCSR